VPVVVEKQCSGSRVEPEHAEQEPHVADAGRDERLLRGRGGLGFVEPEPDEQIDASPTSSQQMNVSNRLLERTTPSIAAENSDKKQKNRVKFASSFM